MKCDIFVNDIAAVTDETGAYHIKNDGHELYKTRYLKTFTFHEDCAAVEDKNGFFHIDSNNRPLYDQRYKWAGNYHEGLSAVQSFDKKYSFIDKAGRVVFGQYDYATDFRNGLAIILDNNHFNYIRKDGTLLLDKWSSFCQEFDDGYAVVFFDQKKVVIDKNGKVINDERTLERPGNRSKETYSWQRCIEGLDYDDCLLFIRHGDRQLAFLSDDKELQLTDSGRKRVEDVGLFLKSHHFKNISLYSSPEKRCVDSALIMKRIVGSDESIHISDEFGKPGALFIEDDSKIPSISEVPLGYSVNQSIMGKKMGGWQPIEQCTSNLIERFQKMTSNNRLSLCVTHDAFIAMVVGFFTKKPFIDEWINYCDGFIIFSRGDNLFFGFKDEVYDIKKSLENGRSNKEKTSIMSGINYDAKHFFLNNKQLPVSIYSFDHHDDERYEVIRIHNKHGWNYITNKGDFLLPHEMEYCSVFSDGVATIKDGEEQFYIDTSGSRINTDRIRHALGINNGIGLFVTTDGALKTITSDGTSNQL